MNGLNAAKPRRNGACAIGRKAAAFKNLYRTAAFPHRKSGGRIGRKSRVSAWKRGFCMAFAGGAGRGCGFLKAYMRILRGLQSTAPGIVRRSPCSGAARSFMARRPFLGRCRCSGGARTLHAPTSFRSMPFAPPWGVHPFLRPPVRAFFCVSPCHAAQSMV